MTVRYAKSGELTTDLVGEQWVLVFGGVTRPGNRRARRASSRALESGTDVVWFDGFEETIPETSHRVPLEPVGSKANLSIVGFETADQHSLSGRLRSGRGLKDRRSTRWIWQLFTRRLGNILRPRGIWRLLRRDVLTLASCQAPMAIVYGDDYSITSAWYAGRVWPGSPISLDYQGEEE